MQGKYRGCNCLLEMDIEDVVETDGTKYDDNMTFLELQQKILTDFINENSKPPFCNHAASPRGERVPKEYCNCGDENRKTLTYSVATSTASPYEACPYTTNNGPTVTFQDTTVPKATPVIRCATPQERSFKSLDGYEYINTFCNTRNGQKLNIRDTRLNLYDSVSMFFNENKDPYVRIYAYVDDTCRDKGEIKLNSEDCGRALDSIMHQCR